MTSMRSAKPCPHISQKGQHMNQNRRKHLKKLLDRIQPLEEVIEDLHQDVDCLKNEEEEYRESMPDGISDSARGEAADEAINALEEAMQILEQMQWDVVQAAERVEAAMA
jgi:predicted  nucleic acid-binding Zn-ribbon protein